MLEAARQGLSLWFNNVLPALTPFVIGTNILVALGVVSAIGRLLDGFMRPFFRLPGAAGFALATGLMAGYPMGARAAATLAENGNISPRQAARLAGFSNNSGPIFVVGAVGTGMFGDASMGFLILVCHYLCAIAVGVAGGRLAPIGDSLTTKQRPATRNKRRPFGQVLGESVQGAMETLVVVGGFIILFCVIARIMDVLGVFGALEWLVAPLLPEAIPIRGIAIGIIEITNGASAIAETALDTAWRAAALGFVISFGGFSIHAQSLSFLSKANAPAAPYLLGKLAHGISTATLAYAIYSIA